MGVTRKLLSMGTVGLIDFRSDKERIARSTRLSKSAVKSQTAAIRKQTRVMRRKRSVEVVQVLAPNGHAGAVPAQLPPGWYPDNTAPGLMRWWNGLAWTEHVVYSP